MCIYEFLRMKLVLRWNEIQEGKFSAVREQDYNTICGAVKKYYRIIWQYLPALGGGEAPPNSQNKCYPKKFSKNSP